MVRALWDCCCVTAGAAALGMSAAGWAPRGGALGVHERLPAAPSTASPLRGCDVVQTVT